jgi:hypothetical protein
MDRIVEMFVAVDVTAYCPPMIALATKTSPRITEYATARTTHTHSRVEPTILTGLRRKL